MMTETESFIQVKERDTILKIWLKDNNGNDTGKYLRFDLESVNYPLRLNECIEMHKSNVKWLKDQAIILDKKEDKKGKKILTWKQEETFKLYQKFYYKEMEALDMFLGKGATQMILDVNGDEPYYSMFDDIVALIEPIMPKLEDNVKYIKKKQEDIIKKYSSQESNVLK
jgi:hypothetical protein